MPAGKEQGLVLRAVCPHQTRQVGTRARTNPGAEAKASQAEAGWEVAGQSCGYCHSGVTLQELCGHLQLPLGMFRQMENSTKDK